MYALGVPTVFLIGLIPTLLIVGGLMFIDLFY